MGSSAQTETEPKKTKGRQKTVLKKIEKKSQLQVTFSKRKAGLFKNAAKFSADTGAEIGIILFSPGNKPFTFGLPSVDHVVDQFLAFQIPSNLNGGGIDSNVNEKHSIGSDLTKEDQEVCSGSGVVGEGFWWEELDVEKIRTEDMEDVMVKLEEVRKNVVDKIGGFELGRKNLGQIEDFDKDVHRDGLSEWDMKFQDIQGSGICDLDQTMSYEGLDKVKIRTEDSDNVVVKLEEVRKNVVDIGGFESVMGMKNLGRVEEFDDGVHQDGLSEWDMMFQDNQGSEIRDLDQTMSYEEVNFSGDDMEQTKKATPEEVRKNIVDRNRIGGSASSMDMGGLVHVEAFDDGIHQDVMFKGIRDFEILGSDCDQATINEDVKGNHDSATWDLDCDQAIPVIWGLDCDKVTLEEVRNDLMDGNRTGGSASNMDMGGLGDVVEGFNDDIHQDVMFMRICDSEIWGLDYD